MWTKAFNPSPTNCTYWNKKDWNLYKKKNEPVIFVDNEFSHSKALWLAKIIYYDILRGFEVAICLDTIVSVVSLLRSATTKF